MNATSEPLHLDSESISSEDLSMPTLMRELNLQKRPSWILSKLMNALEHKRQAKGMGWSRVWNKENLNVFRTHTHDIEADSEYLNKIRILIAEQIQDAPENYQAFAQKLLNDPKLMVFTFYHNHDSEKGQYEGLTVSLGTKVESDRSKRNRIDIILEDRRLDGRVDGLIDRIRIYVCPWSQFQNDKKHYALEIDCPRAHDQAASQAIFEESIRCYHKWKGDESRQWNHWSANYIDYFGPRTFIPVGTSFS